MLLLDESFDGDPPAVDIEAASAEGTTPLGPSHSASRRSCWALSTFAAASSGDMSKLARGGTGIASECGHADVVEYLAGRGAQLDSANRSAATPLYMAAQAGDLDMVTHPSSAFFCFICSLWLNLRGTYFPPCRPASL